MVNALKASGIEVWLDREQIRPGYRWADAIREAISQGDFFIACFSKEYRERSKTYMNEELTLAIEELRQRSASQSWFIPVLLSDYQIPDRIIGAGETLRSIQWVNLYEDWDFGVKNIISVIQPISEEYPRLDEVIDINNFVELWTPKTIRLGFSSGLLTAEREQIGFSEQFLDTLCTEGRKWSEGEYTKWDEFILVSMARATYKDGVEIVPLYQEDAEYLFTKLPSRVFRHLINLGLEAKVLAATKE